MCAHVFQYLEQNKRMEDIVTGLVSKNVALVSQNTVLQSELQIILTAAEQDSEENVEQDSAEDVAEQDFEEDQYDEQEEEEVNGAVRSKRHIMVHESHHTRVQNGNNRFKRL
jgi:hypothetical protein